MKKLVFVLMAFVLLAGTSAATVYAHGGGRGHGHKKKCVSKVVSIEHELCSISRCEEAGLHEHDGTWYCGQKSSRNHNADCSLNRCSLDGCAETGLHEHEGIYYHCSNHKTRN